MSLKMVDSTIAKHMASPEVSLEQHRRSRCTHSAMT